MRTPFFDRVGNIFVSKDNKLIWQNIALANLIQTRLAYASGQPTVKDIATINSTFEILL